MKDYYNLFVELSLQQCTKDEYTNKQRVKKHNTASKQLKQLQAEMKSNDSKEILFMLLNHKDDRVKVNAASLCLQINVLVDEAIHVLKEIIAFSNDSTICFSAKTLLQKYK